MKDLGSFSSDQNQSREGRYECRSQTHERSRSLPPDLEKYRRSSSSDQNQSREGRYERRDQTWFLKPERSRSLPPDLEKYPRQAAIESLGKQGVKLINGFNNLLIDIQQNAEDGLSLKRGQIRTYRSLVQSYTIYKGSQFALDTNNYLTVEHLNKIKSNGNKLEKLANNAFYALDSMYSIASLKYLNEYSNKFIKKSKKRNKFAKELNSFLEDIKINQIRNLPLTEEQVKTYEHLTSRSHKIFRDFAVFTFRKSLFKDYCNEEQQLQVKREVERISSISADADETVQSIRLAHPTFRDLRSQRTVIGKRWHALVESYQEKVRQNLPPSKYEYEWSELCKIGRLMKDYKATKAAFDNTEHAKSLAKHQEKLLQLDQNMIGKYKIEITSFLASNKDWINNFLLESDLPKSRSLLIHTMIDGVI